MPKIKIHNKTSISLNLSLSHLLVPLHFQNELKPKETWEIEVGSVWFNFECRPDRVTNRFSAMRSAQTIGLITLTGASIGLVAIPLTVIGLAPIAGPSTALAHLATNSLLTAGATPQVLGLTTWLASIFAKKTVYQLATERGIREDELEETVKRSSMIIDSLRYLSLSKSLIDLSKLGRIRKEEGKGILKSEEIGLMGIMSADFFEFGSKWLKDIVEGKSKNNLIDFIHQSMVEERNEEIEIVNQENQNQNQDEIQIDSEESWTLIEKIKNHQHSSNVNQFEYGSVKGVYIGFGDDYEFEWREKIGGDEVNGTEMGNVHGFELWDLKLGSILS
ncbi:hypothetical protein DFH28DRAFT_425642 [Melampsora americana]|nr:hypothetical protein DFH28DRAFT_425642 [Melampsora americana]